jgi:hypothetical protein
MKFLRLFLVLVAGLGAISTSFGQVYDAFAGFSGTQNPIGVWSYGWSTDLAGPLTVYPDTFAKEGGTNWTDFTIEASGDPNVAYVPVGDTGVDVPAGTMAFHPGPGNQFSHCRFTAPIAGVYNIAANFTSISYGGPHGYVLHNGVSLGDSLLAQGTPWSKSINSVTLAAGDTIDAVVGVGTDGFYSNDETTFSLTVTAAPSSPPPPGNVYDAKADFSFTKNPHGQWTYGWSVNIAGPLTVYGDPFTVNGIEFWGDNSIEELNDPHVGYSPLDEVNSNILPHTMVMHPGPGNQFTHCIWTAPTAGMYQITSSFTSLSYGGPHAYILQDGVTIGDSLLTQGVPWSASYNSVALAAGDTIEAVVGVGSDGVFFNDETQFSFTITGGATRTASFTPGVYRGLLTGASGPGGVGGAFTAHLQKDGQFTARLNFGGERVTLNGRLNGSSPYSTVVRLKDGTQLTVSLSDVNGSLTGTVSDGSESFALSAAVESDTVSANGIYPFTISASGGTGDVPQGTGFGFMYVEGGGAVSLVGQLGDGTSFSTASAITSGSSVSVYADPYGSAGGGVSGTLVFQDVPEVSDCAGTLTWIRPARGSSSPYAGGFTTSAQFVAARFDPAIDGLNHDDASFVASGADLQANFTASVTLRSDGGAFSLFGGNATNVHLSILPGGDLFFGSFEDGTTHAMHAFTGVLLPKSRTGAGFFFSGGVSGSVNLGY